MKKQAQRYFFTLYIVIVISLLWQIFEIWESGCVQKSIADSVIMMIFMPFIYSTVCTLMNIHENFERASKAKPNRELDATGKMFRVDRLHILWFREKDASYRVRVMLQIMEVQMQYKAKKSGDDGSASEDD